MDLRRGFKDGNRHHLDVDNRSLSLSLYLHSHGSCRDDVQLRREDHCECNDEYLMAPQGALFQ